ncbi:MAG: mycothiol system anti-sigma-R factor [Cyclobacteriaceae bacterium]|nr:mycothiol system anti-sigma-R factor [Cytophagales bacterium]MBX2900176.1 mycothiol system anti-sigma-R factor [Cyclobacteriaceae bacterium]
MTPPHNPFILADGKKPTCMEMLQLILDGEATAEQQHYFKVHMDKCMPCFKTYSLDATIKELLQDKCCKDVAPAELIEQIKLQISQNQAG